MFGVKVAKLGAWSFLKNHASPNTPITAWPKNGFEYLFLPPRDLTQCMDVSPNPGPTFAHVLASKRACRGMQRYAVHGTKPLYIRVLNQSLHLELSCI